jgi:hypothetical protein
MLRHRLWHVRGARLIPYAPSPRPEEAIEWQSRQGIPKPRLGALVRHSSSPSPASFIDTLLLLGNEYRGFRSKPIVRRTFQRIVALRPRTSGPAWPVPRPQPWSSHPNRCRDHFRQDSAAVASGTKLQARTGRSSKPRMLSKFRLCRLGRIAREAPGRHQAGCRAGFHIRRRSGITSSDLGRIG